MLYSDCRHCYGYKGFRCGICGRRSCIRTQQASACGHMVACRDFVSVLQPCRRLGVLYGSRRRSRKCQRGASGSDIWKHCADTCNTSDEYGNAYGSCPDMRTEYSEPLSGRENISSTGTGILGNSHLRNIFNMQRHAVDGGTEIHKAGKP